MVWKALKAAETLENQEISLRVVNVSSMKPINEEAIKDLSTGIKGIITLEEHTIIGGLASIIAFILRRWSIPTEPIAINDVFGQSATNYESLLDHYNLNESAIIRAVKKILS
jgi:transketolase